MTDALYTSTLLTDLTNMIIGHYMSLVSVKHSASVSSAVVRKHLYHRSLPRLSLASSYSTSTTQGRDVRIIEVGPRDGLQNIKQLVPKEVKIELIQRLAETGLRDIEATSFVSPKWVPQLADGHEVLQESLRFAQSQTGSAGLNFPVLAPNAKGLQNANAAGAKEIVVFASVTETFSKANQNCTVDEAIRQARAVTKEALALGIKVRGFVISPVSRCS